MALRPDQSRKTPAVFLDDFVDVDCQFLEAQKRFCDDGTWLAPLANQAADDGEHHLRVGPLEGGHGSKEVSIRLGDCYKAGEASVVPIRWEATKLSSLFPVLDGNIELTSIGEGRCRLGLKASYRPPLDGFGRILDRAVLHRVAQSTVRSFLLQVAFHLEQREA